MPPFLRSLKDRPKRWETKIKTQEPAVSQEVRALNWKETIVITRRDFHDDWGRILEAIKQQTEESFIINPFQPDKALLRCPTEEIARTLMTNKGWVTFGP